MAPKPRAKSAIASAKDPNLTQRIKSKRHINTRGDDSKNTKRGDHCSASARSEDTEIAVQDTANAVANVSAAPLDSIEPVDPRESAEVASPAVLPEWNGRSTTFYYFQYTYKRRSALLEKDELEVADCETRWGSASASDDVLAAAAIMVQMKKDPNYSAPVRKVSSKLQPDSTRLPFIGTYGIPIQAYSTMASSGLQPQYYGWIDHACSQPCLY